MTLEHFRLRLCSYVAFLKVLSSDEGRILPQKKLLLRVTLRSDRQPKERLQSRPHIDILICPQNSFPEKRYMQRPSIRTQRARYPLHNIFILSLTREQIQL